MGWVAGVACDHCADLAVPVEYEPVPAHKLTGTNRAGQMLCRLLVLALHVLLQQRLAAAHHLALLAGLGAHRSVGLYGSRVLGKEL